MRWPRWSIGSGPGDFLPIVVGGLMVFISLPPAILLAFAADRNAGVIGTPLLVILSIGTFLGLCLIVLGIQLCASPGSLAYRIAHGRFFCR